MPGMKEKTPRPARLDITDIMFCAGLALLLVGLGQEIGWGWGLATVGVILTGYAIWLATPVMPPKEGK